VGVSAVACLLVLGVSAPAARQAVTACPNFKGPVWLLTGKFSIKIAKPSGTVYTLVPNKISCAQALALAKKVAGNAVASHTPHVGVPLKGPTGWVCNAVPDSNSHAYTGACGGPGGVGFRWGIPGGY